MDTKFLYLIIDPNATPVAHHTPVLVPVHWQEEVKAGRDQDVQLKVIERVSTGELATWCHRMVICTKKDASPRWTVDFQALNTNIATTIRKIFETNSSFQVK